MSGRIVHILRAVGATPWAMQPEKLDAMLEFLQLRAGGVTLSADQVAARIGERKAAPLRPGNAVAVIPIYGVIAQHASLMTDLSSGGATSVDEVSAALDAALADPEIGTIVLDVDSPGGTIYGVEELSRKIFEARSRKRLVAVANALAASAGYWLASAAEELVVTPSGEVGSIGVYGMHVDTTKMDEDEGVRREVFSAGKYKAEGVGGAALTDDARAAWQLRVEAAYDMFVKAVARNRGVTAATVRNGYGEGRVVHAQQAKELGMVDRVASFEETVARYLKPRGKSGSANAETLRRKLALDTAKLDS